MVAIAVGSGCEFPTLEPAPPEPAVMTDFADLTPAQEEALAQFPAALEALGAPAGAVAKLCREERCAFLKVRSWRVQDAAAQAKAALDWLDEVGPVTIADVAPFMRAAPGRPAGAGPDGCIVLLEDGRGGVARDCIGRPIAMSIGMSHGSAAEMQRQMVYTMSRARAHALSGQAPGSMMTVIEVAPRHRGGAVTFRFPDADVRTLFDLQTRVFPSSLGTSTHFCGIPRVVTYAFRLCKPFMSAETYGNMILKPNFGHLQTGKHAERGALLRAWGGALDFDVDRYVEWRAREEGLPLEAVCPRGMGRPFAGTAAEGAAGAGAEAHRAEEGGRVSAAALLAGVAGGAEATEAGEEHGRRRVRKWGVLAKRGSGTGLFGTRKWKDKLVVVGSGALVYFDGPAVSTTNLAARTVPLGKGCHARLDEGGGGGSTSGGGGAECVITLVSPARDFTFAAASRAEAAAWTRALQEEIGGAEPALVATG